MERWMMEKEDLRELTEEEMCKLMEEMGEKPFRGKQLCQWVHQKCVSQYEEITNLSQSLKDRLEERFRLENLDCVKVQTSVQGDTKKFLFETFDHNHVESVWMRYHHGNSVCISSQVGCRMGCTFCASTLYGLTRSLTAAEMLAQVYDIQRLTGERVSNIILMGMGEPLDNYNEVIRFIRMVSSSKGLNISQRNITVSTCGLVDKIYDLAEEGLQITLAISLHAPNDEIRRKTMPIANRFSMEEIFEACHGYVQKTKRRISFEYSMIAGVNDGKEMAVELARRCKGLLCHVNLIPLNEVKERTTKRSKEENIKDFKLTLEKNGINVTIRREMGKDIDAACGQLRNRYEA